MLSNLQPYRDITPIPVVLVGNKADLKIRREVRSWLLAFFLFPLLVKNLSTVRDWFTKPILITWIDFQVYANEGKTTAEKYDCTFFETSVSESNNDVHEVFWAIFNELKSTRSNAFRRLRKFSVTKIMTLLFGKEYNRIAPTTQSGTVTVLKKDELGKTLEVKWDRPRRFLNHCKWMQCTISEFPEDGQCFRGTKLLKNVGILTYISFTQDRL